MKWLVYLLSAYMLFLSGVPCSGDSDCCEDKPFQTTDSNQPRGDNDARPLSFCSPFFACGSCHSIAIDCDEFELKKEGQATAKMLYPDADNVLFDYTATIWQPPRLA